MPDDLPVRMGDFDVAGVLGQGGSGVVYDARWGHREVALKVLHPTLVATAKEREQFLLEARRLAEITHPGVVKVLAVGELGDGRPFLAMEKLDGETLSARLARGPIGAEIALRLFGQLADAVAALHDRGLVHRDLKPENVMIVAGAGGGGGEHAVLLDFGIAKDLAAPASTTTSDGGVRGTPAYMAPERFFGSAASIATDVYELAVVFFAMLAARLPWDDCGDPEVRLNPLRLADAAPSLPAALDVEVARALSTRAANRPASARAFAEAVRAAMGEDAAAVAIAQSPSGRMTAEVRPLPTPPQAAAWFDKGGAGPSPLAIAPTIEARPRGKKSRRRWTWIVAASVVVVIGGGAAAIGIIAARGGGDAVGSDDPWGGKGGSSTTTSTSTKPETKKVEAPVAPPKSERPLREELASALGHFPKDTQAVIGIVVDEIRQDPDLSTLILADARAKQISALLQIGGCDLDFARTIDWAAIGVSSGTKSVDAIISGRWTHDAIEACLGGVRRADIEHVQGAGGVPLTRLHGKDGDRWLGWLDDRTFMMSTREDAGAAWMAARVRATDGPGGIIAALAKSVDLRAVSAWAVADAAAVAGADVVGTIPAGHVVARVLFGNGAEARVRIRYADAATAHQAHEEIEKQLDAAASGARELGIFEIGEQDTDVTVHVNLERSILHAVAAQAAQK